jgi:hypothetical protein
MKTKPKIIEEAPDPAILRHIDRSVIFLVKTLCLDTNATEATITQNITHYGKRIGRYRITIAKV